MLVRQLSPDPLEAPSTELARPREAPRDHRWGGWLYSAHLATVCALALSNLFHGLILIWTAVAWRRGRLVRWQWSRLAPVMVPLGLYGLCLSVSVAMSIDPASSLDELDDLLALATLPMAAFWIRGPRAVRRLCDVLIGMITLVALWGIGQYYLTSLGSIHDRIPGPFSHYQTFAGILLIGALLVLARVTAPGARQHWWNWGALAVINWTLFLTLTRGSWVALAAAFGALVVVRGRRRTLGFGLAGLVLLLALAPASWQSRAKTIWDLRDPSNYDRLCMIEAGAFMVRERPLFGIGPGQVAERYAIYRHPTAPRYQVKHLHNSFVQQAAERGLLALGAYLWLTVACAGIAYRGYRRSRGSRDGRAGLYLGVLLVLVGFNVAGLFEANWRDTEVQRLILFVLAIPLCLRAARAPRSGAVVQVAKK